MKPKSLGFTLIEVLMAGFILFLVITSVTLIYRGALFSSNKAERVLAINGSVPALVKLIKSNLQGTNVDVGAAIDGQGDFGRISYQWQALLIAKKSALPRLQQGKNELVDQPLRYYLWKVDLNVMSDATNRNFSYEEFSFRDILEDG